VTHEAATYRRLRAAVRAAAAGEPTTLMATTELSSMYAAQYAETYALSEGLAVVVAYDGVAVRISPPLADAASA
jgi:orotidine-5'-phosphate decarboxylase